VLGRNTLVRPLNGRTSLKAQNVSEKIWNFPAFYATQRPITVYTRVNHGCNKLFADPAANVVGSQLHDGLPAYRISLTGQNYISN
jgi:hypothetical protein